MQDGTFRYPLSTLPEFPARSTRTVSDAPVPDDEGCFALWDRYGMLPNIRRHSELVARIAMLLAVRSVERGFATDVRAVRSSALLHDIAKTFCIRNGGSHSQLGASWTVADTGSHALAQGVMLHVYWPWQVPAGALIVSLPFLVMYADKRVRHDTCVTIDERYEDLLDRYGHDASSRSAIREAHAQGRQIERALSAQIGWELHEDTFDCGGLVA